MPRAKTDYKVEISENNIRAEFTEDFSFKIIVVSKLHINCVELLFYCLYEGCLAPETRGIFQFQHQYRVFCGADRIIGPIKNNVYIYMLKSMGQIVLPAPEFWWEIFYSC